MAAIVTKCKHSLHWRKLIAPDNGNDDRSAETIRKVHLSISFVPSPSGHREKGVKTGGEERLVSLEFFAGEESCAMVVPECTAQSVME